MARPSFGAAAERAARKIGYTMVASMPFKFEELSLSGVTLVKPTIFPDARGSFSEIFTASQFAAAGPKQVWVQINLSVSRQNVLRGMHYQLNPVAQGKLISVARGSIFDAVIDIRRESPTFSQWAGAALDDKDRHMLWVPPGFAHGFCVTSPIAEVVYCCTAEYDPASERGIIWNDPAVGIAWPTAKAILSDKDRNYPALSAAEINF